MPDALEAAADLDRRFAQTGTLAGPLHGVVFAIKDQFDTVDMRTTNGAEAFYANDRPPNDATLVKRLRDAGAIILAKSNMGEYASGDRSAFGGVFCNPYATDRSPGGSSGGSGTAVAANLVTCAIGEETAPSIRMPSRFNNIVGLSPSQGLVSRDGMFGGGINDRAGPMCRTVEDVARVLDVIAGYDPADEFTAYSIGRRPASPYERFAHEKSLHGVRIGVLREYMDKSLFTDADFRPGTRFADKKAELVTANAEMTLDLRDRMQHWLAVQQIVLQCTAMQQLDALVYPTGNVPPPILGGLTEPVKNGRGHMAWTLIGQQGFPAITVPAGFTTHVFDRVRDAAAPGGSRLVGPVPARRPVGVDFLGRPFDEATLLRIASAYEAATRHRVPPPAFGPVPQS